MRRTILSAASVCCLLMIAVALPGQTPATKTTPAKTTTAAEPTFSPTEKDILTEINQVRAHPADYITYLQGLKPFFKDKEYRNGQMAVLTQEGWSAVEDAIQFLRTAKPQPPFTVSTGLCKASLAFVKEQSGTGATGHKGSGNSMVEDRVKPYGTWEGGIGENLSYGNESARDKILTWLVDDGFASRGHRKRLMSADYKVFGLSCGPHPEFGTMCVLTMAGGFSDVKPAKTVTPTKPVPKKPTRKHTT